MPAGQAADRRPRPPPACAGRARLDVLALTSKVVMRVTSTLPAQTGTGSLDGLRAIERRVLWLSTAIIDHANRVRPNPSGLKVGGNFDAVNAPFAPDAYRIENGTYVAGPGARAGSENIRTQRIMAHPDVTYRVAAVDEELGVVILRQDFGNTGNYGPGNALTTFELFKIYGGQIHAVEAFIDIMPENTPSGWPNYEVKKP